MSDPYDDPVYWRHWARVRTVQPQIEYDWDAEQLGESIPFYDQPSFNFAGMGVNNTFKFIWDTGASYTVSPHIEDFVNGIKPLHPPIELDGLSTGLNIQGQGLVVWIVTAKDGTHIVLTVDAYYAPGASMRLFSPQSYLQQCKKNGWIEPVGGFTDKELTLTWSDGRMIHALYDASDDLPKSIAYNGKTDLRLI